MLQQYKKIMVAVDGSDEAELAFKKAVNVAIRNNGELLLAHVIDTRSFQTVSSFDGMLVSEYVIRNAACDVLVVRTDLENQLPPKKD